MLDLFLDTFGVLIPKIPYQLKFWKYDIATLYADSNSQIHISI